MIEYVIAATLLFSTSDGRILERPIVGTYVEAVACKEAWTRIVKSQPAGVTFIRASGTLCARSENSVDADSKQASAGGEPPKGVNLAHDYMWLAEMKRKQARLFEGAQANAALREAQEYEGKARQLSSSR